MEKPSDSDTCDLKPGTSFSKATEKWDASVGTNILLSLNLWYPLSVSGYLRLHRGEK